LALRLDHSAGGWGVSFSKPEPDKFVPPLAADAIWSDSSIWGSLSVPGSTSQVSLVNVSNQPKQVRVNTSAVVQSLRIGGPEHGMSLRVADEGTFSATHEVTIERGGRILLDDAIMRSAALVVQPGGRFAGSGTFTGSFENRGLVAIGLTSQPAALNIEGDFIQDRRGTLDVELGGTGEGEFDTILIDGMAQLGGFLDVSLLANVTLRQGDSFEILRASGGIQGTFDLMSAVMVDNIGLEVVYGGDSVILYSSGVTLGDMDRDFDVDEDDVDDFILGLKDAHTYYQEWNRPPSLSGNVNLDADFGFDDIPPFLALVEQQEPQVVPESSAFLLAWTGALGWLWVRRRMCPR
jgi:hypothetical protein